MAATFDESTCNVPLRFRTNAHSSTDVSTASTASTTASAPIVAANNTVADIRGIMQNLDLNQVEHHFSQTRNPFVVCDNVQLEAFNDYFNGDNNVPIALRFVELSANGQIVIIEFPSEIHEETVREFEKVFYREFGDFYNISSRGSMTAKRHGNPNKEADAAYGPHRPTENRIRPPGNQAIRKWITLAVEVARTQTWESLQRAALWWYGYRGIEYILLLQVSEDARDMEFHLYDVPNNPLRQPHVLQGDIRLLTDAQVTAALPQQPTSTANFLEDPHGAPVLVTFDNRRLLHIPANRNLPAGVHDVTQVDLRTVMHLVIISQ